MAFATIDDVKEHAIFKAELSSKSDQELTYLLKRAERQVITLVRSNFENETDPQVLFDLNVVTVFMVDKLYLMAQPDVAENAIIGIQSEDLLERSYSLSKDKMVAAQNFEAEFSSLIQSLRARNGVRRPIFDIGRGPSYWKDDEA